MTTNTDTCPHCGAEEFIPNCEPPQYTCNTQEDELPTYRCLLNQIDQLKTETQKLRAELEQITNQNK